VDAFVLKLKPLLDKALKLFIEEFVLKQGSN
jgi:hypothetical protein